MKPKVWIIACVVTVGLVPLAWWAVTRIKRIEVGYVSDEWISNARGTDTNHDPFVT